MKKPKKGYENRRKIPEMSKIGYQHLKAGRYREAETEFTKILKLAKKDIYALVGLGDLYLAQREFEKAEDCYNKALQVDPDPFHDVGHGIEHLRDGGVLHVALSFRAGASGGRPSDASGI